MMGNESEALKRLRRLKLLTLFLTVLAGVFLLVTLSALSVSCTAVHLFSTVTSRGAATSTLDGGDQSIPTQMPILERRITCNSTYRRTVVCEVQGDVRIHGRSAAIHFLTVNSSSASRSWRVKPHPRKDDSLAMTGIRELTITELHTSPFPCQVNHTYPAIVFSPGSDLYSRNIFHNFADFLVPLYITSRPFSGDVRFLITNHNPWVAAKYKPVVEKFTRYETINLDEEDRVHCFSKVIVGLKRVDNWEFSINPSPPPPPEGPSSMSEFASVLKSAYSVNRSTVTISATRKPRLLIISRAHSRKFKNLEGIVAAATEVGFEVVVGEGSSMAEFASVVNSCDAMLGVHGAGLTNIVFLPEKAVVVQVVPLGGMVWWARSCFMEPSLEMGLRYLEYEISMEESSLVETYQWNDTVFTDTDEISRRGKWREVYLHEQSVMLNLTRFGDVLYQAMQLLQHN